jgi:glycosyltransferase involved in cell wall biosynthesis
MRKVLIISNGPIPAPEHRNVEGGGLRCWGLARGLKQSHPDLDITVAYNEGFKSPKGFTEEQDNIHIRTWLESSVEELIKPFDSVIVSYCMGPLSETVAKSIAVNQQLILDCYVPIYVEASARETTNMEHEYNQFRVDARGWNEVLRKGDLFLCASKEQKRYYQGVISALGRINPVTYHEDPILVVPYGIYREEAQQTAHPIQELIGQGHAKYKKILWFGGIYPWFDLSVLIDGVVKLNQELPSKLIIVGAKNPFNVHPDFLRKYDDLVAYIKENGNDTVLLEDWVKFEERANWYLDSDVVVLINNVGLENELSWRTRLVDFIWANQAIITNGGDAVSEMLISTGAAARFRELDSDAMAEDLLALLSDPPKLQKMKAGLSSAREGLYWDIATSKLGDLVFNRFKPADRKAEQIDEPSIVLPPPSRLTRLTRKVARVPKYVREHGLVATVRKVGSVVKRRLAGRPAPVSRSPKIVLVSHMLDLSGAPFVLVGVAKELHKLYPELPVDFYSYIPAHSDNIAELNQLGIKPRVIRDHLSLITLVEGDVVILNTVAHNPNFLSDLFARIRDGRLRKLIWFIHEDQPELLFDAATTQTIKDLLKTGRLEFRAAGTKTAEHYQEYFGDSEHITLQRYNLPFAQKYHRVLESSDFEDKLSIVLPGTLIDGRKGQLVMFYALGEVLEYYIKPDPSKYRDFELVFVAVENDFMSRQVKAHAESVLGSRLKTHGRLSHEKTLDVIMESNMTACYSLREALPLFVFEGMIMGHPIVRNDSSGMEEQLIDEQNGFYLDSLDFHQVVATLERVLNKEKTSSETLAAMSKASYEIAKQQAEVSYRPLIDSARNAFLSN